VAAMAGVAQCPTSTPRATCSCYHAAPRAAPGGRLRDARARRLLHDVAKPLCAAQQDDGRSPSTAIRRRRRDGGRDLPAPAASRAVWERVAYLVRPPPPRAGAEMRLSTLKKMLGEEGFDELLALARIERSPRTAISATSSSASAAARSWRPGTSARHASSRRRPDRPRLRPGRVSRDLAALEEAHSRARWDGRRRSASWRALPPILSSGAAPPRRSSRLGADLSFRETRVPRPGIARVKSPVAQVAHQQPHPNPSTPRACGRSFSVKAGPAMSRCAHARRPRTPRGRGPP